jgi:anti-sigma factor RsiW
LLRHEHFEQLAAVAARRELTASQEQELHLHLADCPACRQVFQAYEEMHAPLRPELDPAMELVIESRREKVKAAVLQATGSSPARTPAYIRPAQPSTVAVVPWNSRSPIWAGVAAAMIIAVGFWLGVRYERRVLTASAQPPERSVVLQATPKSVTTASVTPTSATPGAQSDTEKHLEDVRYTELVSNLQAEKKRGAGLDTELVAKNRELADSEKARALLQQQVDSESQDLQSTRALLTARTDELKLMEAVKTSDSNTVAALQFQVRELTDRLGNQAQSLDRERQLLANGRDIRDIIGARNLHIIDVYDTDAEGNTRKSFARAFYTEGKSLVFYAYDLPARGIDDGKFVYTAWGERNGNKNKVQRLGILLNDDKGQKRWALNFSDPKVLNEIDSVFLTLERVGAGGTEPKGKRMLTAYLDSQVNHP